jgi:hypothetical protein
MWVSHPSPIQTGSDGHIIKKVMDPPAPADGARIFPQFIRPTALSTWCAIFPQAVLDSVVFSRGGGVAHSPERVVVSHG